MRSKASVTTSKAMQPWTVDDLWSIYNNSDLTDQHIANKIERSTYAVATSRSVISRVLKLGSVEEVKKLLKHRQYSDKTIEAFVEVYRRVKLQNGKVQPVVANISQPKDLDKLLANLEDQFENLKVTMVEVIGIAVAEQTKAYKAETAQELKDLRELAEAAKGTNFSSVLKRKLMGAF